MLSEGVIKTWLVACAFLLGGALVAWRGIAWFERANLYFPMKPTAADPRMLGLSFETVWFDTADGERLFGWFLPAPKAGSDALTVLFFNGNAGNISYRLEKAAILHAMGVNLFLFDYRGYGNSSGRPSEAGLYADAEAAVRVLTETRGVSPERLIFFGESLGAAVAVETALHHPCAGVILESAFTSTADMARRLFPILPLHRVVTQHFDTVSKIGRLTEPMLIVHSRDDEIVPYAMAAALRDAAGGRATLATIRGGHNDAYRVNLGAYQSAVEGFLGGRS